MPRIRVKIEGLKAAATAQAVARMGADAIGLVFAPSPRQVTAEQARQIVESLGPWVSTVGVFVNASADEINRVVGISGIDYVQLHGDETPDILSRIQARCIKAFAVRDQDWLTEVRAWIAGVPASARLHAVLLDAYDASARGGTGKRFNWQWIADRRSELADLPPIILAGGLGPSCVAEAIRTVQPWGVDVASGVESAPGVKDLDKVRAFFDEVNQLIS